MEITQEQKEFKPIIIKLETMKEAEMLKAVTGNINGNGELRTCMDKIFWTLNELKVESSDFKIIQSIKFEGD